MTDETRHLTAGLLAGIALLMAVPADAGFLDRIREKAEEAADSVRDVRNEVDDIANADDRAAAEIEAQTRQAERDVNAATDIEGQADRAIADSELNRAVLETERDVRNIQTADERAEAALRAEVATSERELAAATDVEGMAEREVRSSDAARSVAQAERDARYLEQTDERAEAAAVSRADQALGVSETRREVDGVEREIGATERALDDLRNSLN